VREITYDLRGFVTVRRDSERLPLRGSLAIRVDPDLGLFSGDLLLGRSAITRTVLGARLLRATVELVAASAVIGRLDGDGRIFATVMMDAVISDLRVAGRSPTGGGSCRTATPAVVPLRSKPGFDLERGGRLAGRYYRPSFTGDRPITPLVNLLASGAGNAAVFDLIPLTGG
jgi:hypothetical protein